MSLRSDAGRWLMMGAVASLAIGAACLDLSQINERQNADTVLPALVSIQHWTPFYWGQNRLGMLLPLLAMPVRNPMHNLWLQDGVGALLTLASPLMLARYAFGRGRGASIALAGMLGALMLVLFAGRDAHWLILGHPEHGVSLFLGLAGLVVIDRGGSSRSSWRRIAIVAAGVALLCLSAWVNLAVPILLALLTLTRFLAGGRRLRAERRRARDVTALALSLAGTGGAVALGIWLSKLFPAPGARDAVASQVLPPAQWTHAWSEFLGETWRAFFWGHGFLAAGIAGALAIGLVASTAIGGGALGRAARRSSVCLIAALIYLLIVPLSPHTAANDFAARYAFPAIVVVVGSAAIFATVALESVSARRRNAIALASAVSLPASILVFWGLPSPGTARTAAFAPHEAAARAVVTSGVTHVAGQYWEVWPTVLYANTLLHERRRAGVREVFGVTNRGRQAAEEWRAWPPQRFRPAVLQGSAWRRDGPAFHLPRGIEFTPLAELGGEAPSSGPALPTGRSGILPPHER